MGLAQSTRHLQLVTAKCPECDAKLTQVEAAADDGSGLCTECKKHPGAVARAASRAAPAAPPPAFTDAERSLIRNTYRFMGTEQLLALLNDRLVADRGAAVSLHTTAQLMEEVRACGLATRDVAQGAWSDMRRRLAQARRDGVTQKITPHTIDDFAVVFGLSPAQVMRLKDALGSAADEGDDE